MDVQGALGLSDELPQRLRADPRLLPRRRRRAGGEAARGRRARAAALGRLRHGHERRPRHGGRGDCVTPTARAVGGPEQAAANRSSQRERPMPPALNLITDPMQEPAPIADFVDAMSTLASGVGLVTCWVGDRPWGMTVTAFASVSAEPPTVLVSLGSATIERARDHCDAGASASASWQRSSLPSPASARSRARPSSSSRSSTASTASSDSPVVAGGARPPRLRALRGRPGRRPHDPLRPRSRCTGVRHAGRRSSTTAAPTGCSATVSREAHRLKGRSACLSS